MPWLTAAAIKYIKYRLLAMDGAIQRESERLID